jgi:hypothetical protein
LLIFNGLSQIDWFLTDADVYWYLSLVPNMDTCYTLALCTPFHIDWQYMADYYLAIQNPINRHQSGPETTCEQLPLLWLCARLDSICLNMAMLPSMVLMPVLPGLGGVALPQACCLRVEGWTQNMPRALLCASHWWLIKNY